MKKILLLIYLICFSQILFGLPDTLALQANAHNNLLFSTRSFYIDSKRNAETADTCTVSISNNILTPPPLANFCITSTPTIIDGSLPQGGINSYKYQWLQSFDGITYFFTGSDTSQSYTPPALSQTTYFRRVVISGGCIDTSGKVAIAIYPNPSVSIVSSATNICDGGLVIFTAIAVNGGSVPSYQWQVNGVNLGNNDATFGTVSLADGDVVSCVMTANTPCNSPVSSNNITMSVRPTPVPTVTVSASINIVCSGTPITFTATPNIGTTALSYQWQLNGANVGSNSSHYTNNALNDNDVIRCTMISNSACGSNLTTVSNIVIATIIPSEQPSVNITASSNNICTDSAVTFTATATNGGSAPFYQWQLNGTDVGTNSPTYTNSAPANGDQVICFFIAKSSCASIDTDTSNIITMHVSGQSAPAISITGSADSVCLGDSLTFTAMISNGGASLFYQWQLNGANIGTNSSTYTSNTFSNGDIVSCSITSNSSCGVNATAASNKIVVKVVRGVDASVNITSSANNICADSLVTFTAFATNGGVSPSYQWQVNGVNTGSNSSVFVSNNFSNGDQVNCLMTSSIACAAPVFSATGITMTVYPLPVIIQGPDKAIKQGTTVSLNPTVTGNIISYQWSPVVGLNNPSIQSPLASPSVTTTYLLKASSANGCIDTASITVKVITDIEIPNIFSPNGDGVNDVWNINYLSRFPNCTVDVFNRYGQPVFHSAGYGKPWDGNYNGNPLPVGTYYYIVDLKNGAAKLAGSVTIIR